MATNWANSDFPGGSDLATNWSDFTVIGGHSNSVNFEANGQLVISDPDGTGSDHCRIFTRPYSGPGAFSIHCGMNALPSSAGAATGMVFRDNSGKFIRIWWELLTTDAPIISISTYNDNTTEQTAVVDFAVPDFAGWLQLQDDGTNMRFMFSTRTTIAPDGTVHFIEAHNRTLGTFITPTQVGVVANAKGGRGDFYFRSARLGAATTLGDSGSPVVDPMLKPQTIAPVIHF